MSFAEKDLRLGKSDIETYDEEYRKRDSFPVHPLAA
jgi:hypothetical protein